MMAEPMGTNKRVGAKQDRITIVRKNLEKIANNTIDEARRVYRSFFSQEMPPVELAFDRPSDYRDIAVFLYKGVPLLSLEMETNYRLYRRYNLWDVFGSFYRIYSDDRPMLGRSLAFICYIATNFPALRKIIKEIGGLWRIYQYDRGSSTTIRFTTSKYMSTLLVESTFDFVFDDIQVKTTASVVAKTSKLFLLPTNNSSQDSPAEFTKKFYFSNNRELQEVAEQLPAFVSSLIL